MLGGPDETRVPPWYAAHKHAQIESFWPWAAWSLYWWWTGGTRDTQGREMCWHMASSRTRTFPEPPRDWWGLENRPMCLPFWPKGVKKHISMQENVISVLQLKCFGAISLDSLSGPTSDPSSGLLQPEHPTNPRPNVSCHHGFPTAEDPLENNQATWKFIFTQQLLPDLNAIWGLENTALLVLIKTKSLHPDFPSPSLLLSLFPQWSDAF